MSSLYQSMIAAIEQSITPLAGRLGQQKYVIAIRDGFTAALPFMIIGSFMLVFIFPPFSPDTTNGFARGWLDFSQQYREQLMLPFNLSMGVMTFFYFGGDRRQHGTPVPARPGDVRSAGVYGFLTGCRAVRRWQNLHPVPLVRVFYRLDHRHLFHPRLRTAKNRTTLRFACRKSADRRCAFV